MNLSNKELKVYDLIKYSEEESIWLPEFQRPFVWDKNQVRLLVDSIYRDYTISSILLWTGGDELARRRVGATIKDIKIPQDKDESVVYLLDGQQRTTALTLAFTDKAIYRGNNTTKKEKVNIYFDTHYQGDDPEMRWVLDDEKIANESNPEEPFMLKEFSDQELFTKFGTRFVKIKHTYNFDDSQIENWFDTSIPEEEIKMLRFKNDYNKELKKLEKLILERKVYEIEQKGTLEQVLEVFERINTKNTKLSIFDIMVAKTYRRFPEGFFDLRSYYKVVNYKQSLKSDYFENLNKIDLDKVEMLVDESFMLQLSMIILDKKFKATEILKIKTDHLMANTRIKCIPAYHEVFGSSHFSLS
jgi:Asp-tRNA(Asn)/Glu-tRNA(Gln) amidotransferase C subunit